MKHYCCFLFAILIIACQGEKKTKAVTTPSKSLLDSIADAYGYQEWPNVKQVSFTFNVERPARKYARSWQWDVKENTVTAIIDTVTVYYDRKQVDSTLLATDARFINDSYWFLFPFKLVWDKESFTFNVDDHIDSADKEIMRKVTIVYGDSGGYTPGDAYDFYIDSDYMIREWAWRKSNDSVAGIRTKLQGLKDYDGLKITTRHEGMKDDFLLHFTSIKVEKVALK
ncbi:MAG: hypothetical protein HKN89_10720 [Eudoraea sp.]|nr:hypothetical protein [Eudoraea sp.]